MVILKSLVIFSLFFSFSSFSEDMKNQEDFDWTLENMEVSTSRGIFDRSSRTIMSLVEFTNNSGESLQGDSYRLITLTPTLEPLFAKCSGIDENILFEIDTESGTGAKFVFVPLEGLENTSAVRCFIHFIPKRAYLSFTPIVQEGTLKE